MYARAIRRHASPRVATKACPPGSGNVLATTSTARRSFVTANSHCSSTNLSSRSSIAPRGEFSGLGTSASVPPVCNPGRSSRDYSSSPTAASRKPEYIPNTPIRVLRSIADVRTWTRSVSAPPDSDPSDPGIGLVPTMGALHAGHTALMRDAAARGHRKMVVSIYVNPAQFGVGEDLDSYPKTWDGDCAVLADLYAELSTRPGRDDRGLEMAVFAPTTSDMYPSGFPGQEIDSKGSFVTVTPVGELLEGKSRPTFFRGVATVCMKLFNIVQPARVFLGQKDVQQTVVIRKMVRDFCMPMEVVVAPTVREEGDGLALSSRNVYLGTRRRRVAPVLIRALRAAEEVYVNGGLQAEEILFEALRVIMGTLEEQSQLSPREGVMFQLDYISLADPDTMEEVKEVDPSKGAILSGAIKMLPVFEPQEGEDLGHNNGPPVRLIDNIILPPKI